MGKVDWESPYEDHDLALDIVVYRAVNPEFVDWNELDHRGWPALTSQIFQDMSPTKAAERGYPEPAMSVALSHRLSESSQGPERVLDEFGEHWGIAEFSVAALRAVQPPLGVCEDPLPAAPWHGLVFGKSRRRIKKPEQYGLMAAAKLIRLPSAT